MGVEGREGIAVSLLFFVCLWLAWCGTAFAADSADLAEGQEIFEIYCGACHGFDGRPLMPGTPSFAEGERLDKSADELLESIYKGRGKVMPGWDTVLSPTECKQVLDFIFSISE